MFRMAFKLLMLCLLDWWLGHACCFLQIFTQIPSLEHILLTKTNNVENKILNLVGA